MYGPENCSDSGEDEEDIDKAIAKEIEGLKNTSHERRFQATNTGVKNVVFIQCRDPVEPCELVHHLFKEMVEEGKQKSRYIVFMSVYVQYCIFVVVCVCVCTCSCMWGHVCLCLTLIHIAFSG